MERPLRKPPWLRRRLPSAGRAGQVCGTLEELHLHTVCQSAHCPNQGECFGRGTATFLLLGPNCTRRCRFCAVDKKDPLPPDPDEPGHTAQAALKLGLKFCVLTMVTRDDLPDGGAEQVARTIRAIKQTIPEAGVEVLISDLGGDAAALSTVLQAEPQVLNHNLETVPRLYGTVRPQADYERSLQVIRRAADQGFVTKSGLMLGLGEELKEVEAVLEDLRTAGCHLLTLGQYLAPSRRHLPVERYLPPEEWEELKRLALDKGFLGVASGPFVRSSYQAESLYRTALERLSR